MVWAIRFEQFGGPEVLKYQQVDVGEPKAGEARVAHRAIGLNFIDVYHRTGLYPMALPSGLGGEGAGVVVAVGPGVTHVRAGDRVVYTASGALGSYSEERILDARWLVRLPAAIDEQTGAAMMLKGLTAWYLLKRSYVVQAGDWILLHAAAGGVGLIAAQWARELGARVIGIVGSAAKRELALAHGCEHVLLDNEDVPRRVREIAGGGVPVVYDSVGRTTFFQSLDCLRPHGLLVSFGNSSGKVEPFGLQELQKRGSLYVTRPTLQDFIRERRDLETGSSELFDLVQGGRVRINVNQTYALRDAAQAHRNLEARRTTGSTVLIP
ncbi:MAG: quinone oxidoreductase [Gammaproteobacteria bacterium]